MTIREEVKDLFTVPQGYYLAHCISHDQALGAGIAKQFNEVYNMREKLADYFPIEDLGDFKDGYSLLVDNVFNLVTKNRAYEKPTYMSLHEALEEMKEYVVNMKITKLAMPRIGCGLDKLEWDNVLEMICDIFENVNVDILICVL